MGNPYLDTLVWVAGTVIFIVVSSLALGGLAGRIARWRGANQVQQQRTRAGYLFAAPWIIGFFIFVAAPMLASLYWSFTRYSPPSSPEWIGADNFIKLIVDDKDFRAALINSLFLTVVGLPLQLLVALGLAVLLSQKLRGERIFRAAFYLPVVLGLNAAALLCWRLMLNANTGIVNSGIRAMSDAFPPFGWLVRGFIYVTETVNAFFAGLQTGSFRQLEIVTGQGFPSMDRVPLWLQSPLWTKTTIILIMVWSCGAMMLIFLASLYNVPSEVKEAATVDGATPWQRFRYVILPLITPAIFYNLIIGTIATIQIFEQTYVLYRDTPTVAQSAYSVVYYLWRATFRFNDMGYGSAISWLLLIIIALITLVQFRFQNRWVQYDLR
ncbi:MAG TPA: sugar ABC transporter permease [Chloroflexia bacterium]|nr:sugar ABC transporter permease [Chloroflexia bacterium]